MVHDQRRPLFESPTSVQHRSDGQDRVQNATEVKNDIEGLRVCDGRNVEYSHIQMKSERRKRRRGRVLQVMNTVDLGAKVEDWGSW